MKSIIKYPIGIQTFSEIIKEGYLYVDKTESVYALAKRYKYAFLSRPRRFGKSLLLSTLAEYFKGNRELFKGLAMESLESEWKKFPVIRFDLSAANYNNIEALNDKISAYLSRMETEYGISAVKRLGDRFMNVILAAYRRSGNRVVILIDEYDKPMLDTIHDDKLQTEMKEELRGFYSVLKECDEMIRFAMLTGVTKFGKVSIFSGLNNLKDLSLIPDFNDICGITEKEFHTYFERSISNFAETNSISEDEAWSRFKSYYDGYHFAWPAQDVYNPFSTLNAFDENRLKQYWFSSGSPAFLIKLIRKYHFNLENLDRQQRTENQLCDITDISRDFIPLLYQAGYLTIKDYDEQFDLYTLGFPNKEVRQGFWDSLANYFFHDVSDSSAFSIISFIRDLGNGDANNFMIRIKSLFASVSSEHEANKEVHFQNMLTIFTKVLGLNVETEVHSSQGRSDIIIKTPRFIYIIELKVDSTAAIALKQIHEKGYARPYEIDPRMKILIGANFSTETRTLTDYLIEKS